MSQWFSVSPMYSPQIIDPRISYRKNSYHQKVWQMLRHFLLSLGAKSAAQNKCTECTTDSCSHASDLPELTTPPMPGSDMPELSEYQSMMRRPRKKDASLRIIPSTCSASCSTSCGDHQDPCTDICTSSDCGPPSAHCHTEGHRTYAPSLSIGSREPAEDQILILPRGKRMRTNQGYSAVASEAKEECSGHHATERCAVEGCEDDGKKRSACGHGVHKHDEHHFLPSLDTGVIVIDDVSGGE